MERRIRVVIADDSARARHGLRAVLATRPECDVVGEAANGDEAIALVERLRPDVVLMDARMPGLDGAQATRIVKARWPGVAVIGLSMGPGERAAMLAAGADAFFAKAEPIDGLLMALTALTARLGDTQ